VPIVCGGLAALACGLADAFRAAEVEPVVITYEGDTALTRGTTVPFTVTVRTNGTLLPDPRLVISSSDTQVIAITAGGDSLKAVRTGPAVLTIVFESSMLADSTPTLAQPLRVKP
jgi:hypothetical protein